MICHLQFFCGMIKSESVVENDRWKDIDLCFDFSLVSQDKVTHNKTKDNIANAKF